MATELAVFSGVKHRNAALSALACRPELQDVGFLQQSILF
jgi:hypothetical protein